MQEVSLLSSHRMLPSALMSLKYETLWKVFITIYSQVGAEWLFCLSDEEDAVKSEEWWQKLNISGVEGADG